MNLCINGRVPERCAAENRATATATEIRCSGIRRMLVFVT